MKHLTIDIYPNVQTSKITVWCDAPAFGDSRRPSEGGRQYGILNDGQHRVKFGVFNAMLDIETIKALARVACCHKVQQWDEVWTLK